MFFLILRCSNILTTKLYWLYKVNWWFIYCFVHSCNLNYHEISIRKQRGFIMSQCLSVKNLGLSWFTHQPRILLWPRSATSLEAWVSFLSSFKLLAEFTTLRFVHLKIKGQIERQETFLLDLKNNSYSETTDSGRYPSSVSMRG